MRVFITLALAIVLASLVADAVSSEVERMHPKVEKLTREHQAKIARGRKADDGKASAWGDAHQKIAHTPVSELTDTKVCYFGYRCKFGATMKVALDETAVTAGGRDKKKNGNIDVKLKFHVRSMCGSTSHQFYHMDITEYHSDKDDSDEADRAIKKYPTYFTQSKASGKIDRIYGAKGEKKFATRIKHGLIEGLSKQIHHKALAGVKKKPAGHATEYLFIDTDTKGEFTARHTLTHMGGGVVNLQESKDYSTKSQSVKGDVNHGQRMDMERKSKSKTELGADGRAKKVAEKDKLDVGTTKPLKTKPQQPTPSTGKTKFVNNVAVKRYGKAKLVKRACGTKHIADFEIDIQKSYDGEDFVSRAFRAPLTDEEMSGDEGWTEEKVDPVVNFMAIKKVLQSGKPFTVAAISRMLTPDNVDNTVKLAGELWNQGELSVVSFKKVMGALSHVRCKQSYRHLLNLLHAEEAPEDLRMQSVVSLLHGPTDPVPSWDIVSSVAQLAHKPESKLHSSATMLLGALLSRHPRSTDVLSHIIASEKELEQMSPDNEGTRARSVALMALLQNAGEHHAADSVLAIKPFLKSKFEDVRDAAADAMRKLGATEEHLAAVEKVHKLHDLIPEYADEMMGDNADPVDLELDHQEHFDGDLVDDGDNENENENELDSDDLDDEEDLQVGQSSVWQPWKHQTMAQEDAEGKLWQPWEKKKHTPLWQPWAHKSDMVAHKDTDISRSTQQFDDYSVDDAAVAELQLSDPGEDINEDEPDAYEAETKHGQGGVFGGGGPTPTFGKKALIVNLNNMVLAGGGDFEVKALLSSGARWSFTSVGGFANGKIRIRVMHFDQEVVQAGMHARIHPASKPFGVKGVGGEIAWYVLVMGFKIGGEKIEVQTRDVHVGTNCPTLAKNAQGCRWRPPKMWFKTLFTFVKRMMVGPVPVKITIMVIGGVGYQIIFGAYINCNNLGWKGSVMLGGLAPRGRVDVSMEAAIDVGIASAGIQGILMVLRGDTLIYAVGSVPKVSVCGHLDLELQALSGIIKIFVKVLVMKFTLPIIKWEGPKMYIPILNTCKPWGKHSGHFGGNQFKKKHHRKPGELPHWRKALARDMRKGFGNKWHIFPNARKLAEEQHRDTIHWPVGKPGQWPAPKKRGLAWPWNDPNHHLRGFPVKDPNAPWEVRAAVKQEQTNQRRDISAKNGDGTNEPYEPLVAAAREVNRYVDNKAPLNIPTPHNVNHPDRNKLKYQEKGERGPYNAAHEDRNKGYTGHITAGVPHTFRQHIVDKLGDKVPIQGTHWDAGFDTQGVPKNFNIKSKDTVNGAHGVKSVAHRGADDVDEGDFKSTLPDATLSHHVVEETLGTAGVPREFLMHASDGLDMSTVQGVETDSATNQSKPDDDDEAVGGGHHDTPMLVSH